MTKPIFANRLASGQNPFEKGTTNIFFRYEWVSYTFGSLFIILGILIFITYPKANRKKEDYKRRQLIEFHKNNPNKKNLRYEQTRLYLPFWEKVKLMTPMIMGSLFVIIGISWMIGQGMSSL